ncbi:MAG: NAD-dependent epimerase/dehydratase family protein [Deltaproteobacteria bacterium]
MPRLARQAQSGALLTVYGDGTQMRCFCDDTDSLAALLCLLEGRGAVDDEFNVGSSEKVSIEQLPQRIVEAGDEELVPGRPRPLRGGLRGHEPEGPRRR